MDHCICSINDNPRGGKVFLAARGFASALCGEAGITDSEYLGNIALQKTRTMISWNRNQRAALTDDGSGTTADKIERTVALS